MKVQISWDRDGRAWRYRSGGMKGPPLMSYPAAVRDAVAAGHEVDNAGWRHRLLAWNFNMHAIDGYPEWEIEREKSPAFVRLAHTRSEGSVESSTLANEWDDVAAADFYQRDWTEDGIPVVRKGETYWSGWWFATLSERDRFLAWLRADRKRSNIAVDVTDQPSPR